MAKHKGKLVSLSDDLKSLQQGTNDDLSGTLLFGDATNSLSGMAQGGNDNLHGAASLPTDFVAIYGDTFLMVDSSRGGNDSIFGADFLISGVNDLFGDARYIFDNAQGGNDYLKGGDFGNINNIFGDAWSLGEGAGGNDVLVGGTESSVNIMYGDAQIISPQAFGGDDTISAGTGTSQNFLFGDSEVLYGKGGSDVLTGANVQYGENILYGDAYEINSGAVGGNDVLQAGNATVNTLFGDARFATGNITCGDDVLISGNGVDRLWGDTQQITNGQQITGADRFVLAPGNNDDTIYDFESGQDLIDLTAFGFASVQDIRMTLDPAGNFQIQFADGGTLTLIGVTLLQLESDILI